MMLVKELALSSVLILTLGSLAGAGGAQLAQAERPEMSNGHAVPPVSLLRLVARCQDFQSKTVMTTGYASFSFENFQICPSSELSQHDPASCFWLKPDKNGIPSERLADLEEWSKTWVSIEAKVNCSEYRHAGSLEEIQFIVEHEKGEVLWSTDPALKGLFQNE